MYKWCVGCVVLNLALMSISASAADLMPAAGDRIRVDVFGRSDLSVEQDIQPSGTVRLPLIGEIEAAGLTLDAIEASIREVLARGVEANPSVLVTVVRWRPVYVMGDVREPRAVDYAPDLTVLKAVTLAGGYGIPGGGDMSAVEAIRSGERLATAYAQHDELQLRRARLEAERDGFKKIDFPPGLAAGEQSAELAELIDNQRRIFDARGTSFRDRLQSLDRLTSTYQDEIAALQTQKGTLTQELAIVSSDVQASETLEAQGLELRSRNSATLRSRLDVESRLAENTSLISRASANLEDTRQRRLSVPVETTREILTELDDVQKELRHLREVITAESRLQGVGERTWPGGAANSFLRREVRVGIVRGEHRFPATETTALEPGDVVEVALIDAPSNESDPPLNR